MRHPDPKLIDDFCAVDNALHAHEEQSRQPGFIETPAWRARHRRLIAEWDLLCPWRLPALPAWVTRVIDRALAWPHWEMALVAVAFFLLFTCGSR